MSVNFIKLFGDKNILLKLTVFDQTLKEELCLLSPNYKNILLPTFIRNEIQNQLEDPRKTTSSCFRQLTLSIINDQRVLAERNAALMLKDYGDEIKASRG